MSTRRKKLTDAKHLDASLEHDRVVRAQRARLEDEAAREFWQQQRQAQGYAASQLFGRDSAQEHDADVQREMRLSALRDRIRIVSREELDCL